MTVKREKGKVLNFPPEKVIQAIRSVLDIGHPLRKYTKIKEHPETNIFSAVIKPYLWPIVLSTPISIEFKDLGHGTLVTVKTTSQVFIFGDIFGFYNRYIRKFFQSITNQLTEQNDGADV